MLRCSNRSGRAEHVDPPHQLGLTGLSATELLDRTRAQVANAAVHAGLSSLLLADRRVGRRTASFQLLATDGACYHPPHAWHFDLADRLVAADPQLVAQTRRVLNAPQTSTGRFAYPGTNSGLARTEKLGSTAPTPLTIMGRSPGGGDLLTAREDPDMARPCRSVMGAGVRVEPGRRR